MKESQEMNGRRAVIGLCMACALLVSAFAASGAHAAAVAHTCVEGGTPTGANNFTEEHCQTVDNVAPVGPFHHVGFGNISTKLTGESGTFASGVQTLKATINGINTELKTSTLMGDGSLTKNDGTTVAGNGTIVYENVVVAAPAGKGCKVVEDNGGAEGTEGVVKTNPLSASTTSPTELEFTPTEGETFATFFIKGCTGSEALEGLNKTYSVTGSLIGTPKGAETVAEHGSVTTQNTLKLNGSVKAGLNGGLTIKGKTTPPAVDTFKPLSLT
jgi:hypothetical protein